MENTTKNTVSVRYFSILAQITNKRSETILFTNGQNVNHLMIVLGEKYPNLKSYLPYTRVAVNHVYVSLEHLLVENDEIALITPVSGG